MVHRTYYGLGPAEVAVREFDGLAPYVRELMGLRRDCTPLGPDDMALGIALDGLETAAYHFTRRRNFYHALETILDGRAAGNGRLADRAEATAAFRALSPYAARLLELRGRCRPFGRDYLALDIARQGLETAAYHFTREAQFYGAKSDSSGPLRPGG